MLSRGPHGEPELHEAAIEGSVERTLALLSRGADINQGGNCNGATPLMFAVCHGQSRVARVLLKRGANTSLMGCDGSSALHVAARRGDPAMTKLLLKSGVHPDSAMPYSGNRALHLAACRGHFEAMTVLIEAGANLNSRLVNGSTPLHEAASQGHVVAIKLLLRAKANPLLLARMGDSDDPGQNLVPLDVAAKNGHLEVVQELVGQLGIEGCGGESGGGTALELAAAHQHVDVMAVLTEAGAVDTGFALIASAQNGCESSVKFLLQRKEEKNLCQGPYAPETFGVGAWYGAIGAATFSTSRIMRMFMDAGVNTSSNALFRNPYAAVLFNGTPLGFTIKMIRGKTVMTKKATKAQLRNLEATRRVLVQVEAVHALSWLWQSDVPAATDAAVGGATRTKTTSAPLTGTLSILRRRARRRGVLRGALSRWVVMQCEGG